MCPDQKGSSGVLSFGHTCFLKKELNNEKNIMT